MKVLGITQARVGSSRLPHKVLMEIKGKSILQYHLERALRSLKVDQWIVATTNEPESSCITDIAEKCGVKTYQGDLENVLYRYYEAAKIISPDYVVRITSDCPLVDPELIDQVVDHAIHNNLTYCRTSEEFPDGFDVEVFSFTELVNAFHNATLKSDKEHVTPYIRRNNENTLWQYPSPGNFKTIRVTVDELNDFESMCIIIDKLGANLSWTEYTSFIQQNPSYFTNQHIIRNEGYLKSRENDSSHRQL